MRKPFTAFQFADACTYLSRNSRCSSSLNPTWPVSPKAKACNLRLMLDNSSGSRCSACAPNGANGTPARTASSRMMLRYTRDKCPATCRSRYTAA
ncbi:hypothetical protein D3C71_1823900 [compost metagenome]